MFLLIIICLFSITDVFSKQDSLHHSPPFKHYLKVAHAPSNKNILLSDLDSMKIEFPLFRQYDQGLYNRLMIYTKRNQIKNLNEKIIWDGSKAKQINILRTYPLSRNEYVASINLQNRGEMLSLISGIPLYTGVSFFSYWLVVSSLNILFDKGGSSNAGYYALGFATFGISLKFSSMGFKYNAKEKRKKAVFYYNGSEISQSILRGIDLSSESPPDSIPESSETMNYLKYQNKKTQPSPSSRIYHEPKQSKEFLKAKKRAEQSD